MWYGMKKHHDISSIVYADEIMANHQQDSVISRIQSSAGYGHQQASVISS